MNKYTKEYLHRYLKLY